MDSYVDLLQSHGASMVMLAKGNRSQQVTDACHKHGGFYLGSIGGPAQCSPRRVSRASSAWPIRNWGWKLSGKSKWKIFRRFILVDDKGNDFFQQIQNKQCAGCKQHG